MKIIRESQLKRIIRKLINENFENLNEEIPVQNRFEFEEFLIGTINSYRKLALLLQKDISDIEKEINMTLLKKRDIKQKELDFCLENLRRIEEEYRKAIAEWERNKI